MRSTRSFATTSFAGTLLALMIATGAAPSLSPIVRDVAGTYRSAVRAYDKARMWGVIARWWVDPEYVPAARDERSGFPLLFSKAIAISVHCGMVRARLKWNLHAPSRNRDNRSTGGVVAADRVMGDTGPACHCSFGSDL
jgi:hypothetical protein